MSETETTAVAPGAAMDALAASINALRDHCPWTQALSHESLLEYLVEEAYEVVETVETAGPDPGEELRDELGDVLYQVLLHARIAQERGAFDLAEVAKALNAKLIRRNPHIFHPDGSLQEHFPASIADIEASWDRVKRSEKPARKSALEGVPDHLPALARAAKMLSRAQREGAALALPAAPASCPPRDEEELGEQLLALAVAAHDAGLDPERALRTALRRVGAPRSV